MGKRQPVYDVLESPVCVGILPELFRKRPGVHRSWHPTHSVAAYGADAEAFVRGDENCRTPCARGSAWGRLYDRDAYALLVGVELNRMTFFHGVEEWANMPERVDTEHPLRLVIVPPEGPRVIGNFAPHMADSSQLFPKAEDLLLREGAMRQGAPGRRHGAHRLLPEIRGRSAPRPPRRSLPLRNAQTPMKTRAALSQIRRGRRDCL